MFTKIETVFLYAKKINKLFTGLGSVRIVKNCDLGLENAALGLRPRAAFSRPRSQFFTIRTSQPANNIYLFLGKNWGAAKAPTIPPTPPSGASDIGEVTARSQVRIPLYATKSDFFRYSYSVACKQVAGCSVVVRSG